MEHKHLNFDKTEFKFGTDGSLQFTGYASVFGGVDSYGDTIAPGAYKNTLVDRERPVALRWNHYGPVIGKYLEIYEDERGLVVEGELTKGHSVADDAAALLKHGAISGLSIGYIAKDSEDNMPHAGRLLKQIDLIEVSIVEEPADNAARVDTMKSALSGVTELKDIEAILRREIGLSQRESTVIVSSVKNALKHRDDVRMNTLNILTNFKIGESHA